MVNLLRMDLYRMWKSRTFKICLILSAALALFTAPLGRLLYSLAATLSREAQPFPAETNLSVILADPFPMLNLMLALISLCSFFYADLEHGYIKNIAGQMPMKGFTVLSKFLAAGVHNLIFAAVGIVGMLAGTLFVQRIVPDGGVADSIRVMILRLLLVQSICAILLLVTATFRGKSVGMILAVLFGMGFTTPFYSGINYGLAQIFGPETNILLYMPDIVMSDKNMSTVRALLVAGVTGCVFLLPAIRIFDRKDVK